MSHMVHIWNIYRHLPAITINVKPNVGKYAIHGASEFSLMVGDFLDSLKLRTFFNRFFFQASQFQTFHSGPYRR